MGTFPITIQGSNGNVTHTTSVILNIRPRSPLVSFLDPTLASGADQVVFYVGTDQHVWRLSAGSVGWKKDDITSLAAGAPLASVGSPLTGFLDPTSVTGASQSVFYVADDQHVRRLFATPSGWFFEDITGTINAPLVGITSPLVSFLDPTSVTGATQTVFYIDANQQLNRLFRTPSGWLTDNITSQSGAPLASVGSSLTAFLDPTSVTGANQSVFYIDINHHVSHIFKFPAGWQRDDVTALSGALAAVNGSSLSSILDPTNSTGARQSVYYIGSDQHVRHIFAFTSTGTWMNDDLTAISNAPVNAATGSQLSSFLSPTGAIGAFQSIFYTGADQHLRHIFSTSVWNQDDPWFLAHAPVMVGPASPVSSFLDASFVTGADQAIFYVGTDHHIYHLFASPTAWVQDDLTSLTQAVNAN